MSTKSRPTQFQMKSLVELLTKDPQLCTGKFNKIFTHKIAKQRWENIAIQLNALPGVEKTGEKWKKVSCTICYWYLIVKQNDSFI